MMVTAAITEQPTTISSLEANYEGNTLHLKGDVSLEHPLGTMIAEYAELQAAEEGGVFSKMTLGGRVHVDLNDKTELECARAELDLTAFFATLFSEEGGRVRYIRKDSPAMTLQSKRIDATFRKERDIYSLKEMRAQEGVVVSYENTYTIDADRAVYEKKEEDVLVLYPKEGQSITVQHSLWGLLETDAEVTILAHSISTIGRTKMAYKGSIFSCQGALTVHQDEMTCHLIGEGSQQVVYEDKDVHVLADRADVKLAQGIKPAHIALTGHVQLEGKNALHKRRALADRADCDVSTGTVVLFASPGGQVLFADEERNVQMSASEVRIIKDPKSGVETVQGVGSVRFSLTDQENTLLQSRLVHE